jgi:muramoyltetrapeptide carboxypeptidase
VHAKIPSIHGTGIARLPKEPSETLDALIQILNGQATQINYPSLRALNDLPPPDLTGTLLACNLCVLTDIVGTASMPDLSGCILVLEEVNEQPYCIDRMLTQLYHSGSLKGVLAIIVGHLTSCVSIKQPTTAIDVFIERTKAFGIPLVGQIPVGHESPNWPIPIGVKARLESAHGHYQLRVLSEIVV